MVVSAKARLGHSDNPIPRRGESKVPLPPSPGNARSLRKFLSPTRTPWFLADIANEYPDLAYMRFFLDWTDTL